MRLLDDVEVVDVCRPRGSRRLEYNAGGGVVRLLNVLDVVDVCQPRGSRRLLDIMLGFLLLLTLFSDALGHSYSASGHTDCKFLLVTHSARY